MKNLLSRQSNRKTYKTPLLFVHGQWFGSWCWEENYFTFFNDRGFDTHAIDLPGDNRYQRTLMSMCGIRRYMDGLTDAIRHMSSTPILIGHGLGANLILRYIAARPSTILGACLLAPLPSDRSDLWTGNFQKQHSFVSNISFNLGIGNVLRKHDIGCKALFTDNLPKVQRRHHRYYLSRLRNDSPRVIRELTDQQVNGGCSDLPVSVIGASRDTLVDPVVVNKIADELDVKPVFIDVAHAMMLDVNWYKVSHEINNWIDTLGVS